MAWKAESAYADRENICPECGKATPVAEPVQQQPWKPMKWFVPPPGQPFKMRVLKPRPEGTLGLSEEKVSA